MIGAEKIFYYQGDHSAVISTIDIGEYESKWGSGPLMRHAPNYGPDTYNMDYRKYYRRNIDLSGPQLINGQSTYTLSGSYSNASVSWTSSSNININNRSNSSCVLTPNVSSGFGWIKATVTKSFYVYSIQKDIWLGTPNPDFIQTDIGRNNTLYPHIEYYNDAFAYWKIGPYAPILGYQWEVAGWNVLLNPNSDVDIIPNSIVRFDPTSPGNPTYVKIRGRKIYGWGAWSNPRAVEVNYSNTLSLYPNPATDVVTLSFNNKEVSTYNSQNSTYIVKVYNQNMQLVKTKNTYESTIQIQILNLPSGIYFIVVSKNGQLYKQTLIKR